MEGQIIVPRAVLGILLFVHLLLNYAGASGACHGYINPKLLKGAIWTELVLVTAYIIYDKFQTPPIDGWFLAIVGYVVVYGFILMTWFFYDINTKLCKDEVYEMTINARLKSSLGEQYLRGTVIEREQEIEVWLPYRKDLDPNISKTRIQFVKFKEVKYATTIIVEPA